MLWTKIRAWRWWIIPGAVIGLVLCVLGASVVAEDIAFRRDVKAMVNVTAERDGLCHAIIWAKDVRLEDEGSYSVLAIKPSYCKERVVYTMIPTASQWENVIERPGDPFGRSRLEGLLELTWVKGDETLIDGLRKINLKSVRKYRGPVPAL